MQAVNNSKAFFAGLANDGLGKSGPAANCQRRLRDFVVPENQVQAVLAGAEKKRKKL